MKNQTTSQATAIKEVRSTLKNNFFGTTFSVQLKNVNRNRDHIIVVEWVNGPSQSEVTNKIDQFGDYSKYEVDFVRYTRKYTAHFLLSILLQFCIKNNIPTNVIEIVGEENDSSFYCSLYSMYYEMYKELDTILVNLNGKNVKDIYAETETAQEKFAREQKEQEEAAAKAKKAQEEWVKQQRAKEDAELKAKQKQAKEKAEKERKEQEEKAKKQQKNQGWDSSYTGKQGEQEDFKSYYERKRQEEQARYNSYSNHQQEAPKTNTNTNTIKNHSGLFWNKFQALKFLKLDATATPEEVKAQVKKIILSHKVIDTEKRSESFKNYEVDGIVYIFNMDVILKAKEKAMAN